MSDVKPSNKTEKHEKKKLTVGDLIKVLFTSAAIVFLIYSCAPETETEQEKVNTLAIIKAADHYARESLGCLNENYNNVKFERINDHTVYGSKGEYTVRSLVDHNKNGTWVRMVYNCELKRNPENDKWELKKIEFEQLKN